MSLIGLVQGLLYLSVAAAAAALLSPMVINASMIVSGPRKASRMRTARTIAVLAAAIASGLCLVRAAAGWPNTSLIWTVFAAFTAGLSCLIASESKEPQVQSRLVLSGRVLIAIGALLYLLSDHDLHSPLAFGAVVLIVVAGLDLLVYWRAGRQRQGRELRT